MPEAVNPWAGWFTSTAKPYLKIGRIRAPESRPKIPSQPKITTFSCQEEYTVHVGFSPIFEHEYATHKSVDAETKECKEIQTRMKMFTLPSNSRFYFAYIKVPDNFDFKEDDNFDIRPRYTSSLSEVRAVIIEKTPPLPQWMGYCSDLPVVEFARFAIHFIAAYTYFIDRNHKGY
ncbi:hypothetical protein PENNAL_c0033G05138 [Penicillium nalgiovense]|uniref:Uncharacterized protein n=1 Tax=Penicillium nalgiovense TaxID=60175 RepID=A0A1V6Y7D4_PENNA|nr:hypothetical protein PENNAL_c0033G05138 [Penicillium nalgiovense]